MKKTFIESEDFVRKLLTEICKDNIDSLSIGVQLSAPADRFLKPKKIQNFYINTVENIKLQCI